MIVTDAQCTLAALKKLELSVQITSTCSQRHHRIFRPDIVSIVEAETMLGMAPGGSMSPPVVLWHPGLEETYVVSFVIAQVVVHLWLKEHAGGGGFMILDGDEDDLAQTYPSIDLLLHLVIPALTERAAEAMAFRATICHGNPLTFQVGTMAHRLRPRLRHQGGWLVVLDGARERRKPNKNLFYYTFREALLSHVITHLHTRIEMVFSSRRSQDHGNHQIRWHGTVVSVDKKRKGSPPVVYVRYDETPEKVFPFPIPLHHPYIRMMAFWVL